VRDILPDVERWQDEGRLVAIATVVETWGSAPRPAGGKMALTADGRISGSVSGGCVENAVVEAGKKTLANGRPQLLHYGVSDDTAWSVGLACGGSLDVFVDRLDPALFEPVGAALRAEKPVAIATVIRGPEGELGRKLALFEDGQVAGGIDAEALAAARAALQEGASRRVASGDRELFVDVLRPAARLVIVGGVHIAIVLVSLAKTLGFRTILVDPREAFGNARRFPHADEIVNEWPDAALARIAPDGSTAVAVLTHDPKLDDPALLAALPSRAFYVGALGSKRTQEKRRGRLLEAGLSPAVLSRLHGPIGLPLGGRSPEEIAIAILAEVVATRNGAPASRASARAEVEERAAKA
jgi:xanthine dehydrogenase accessory factor